MGERNPEEWILPAGNTSLPEETPEQRFVCEYCGRDFKSGKALGGHMSSAHVQGNKSRARNRNYNSTAAGYAGEFQCRNCPRIFRSKKSMYGHLRTHSKNKWNENDVGLLTFDPGTVAVAGRMYPGFDARDVYAALKLIEISRFVPGEPREESRYGGGKAAQPCFSPARAMKRPLQIEESCSSTTTNDSDDDDYISECEFKQRNKDNHRKWPEQSPGNISGCGVSAGKFFCKICLEEFPSPQAVGGHMSKHKQRPITIIPGAECSTSYSAAGQGGGVGEESETKVNLKFKLKFLAK